MLNDNFFFCLFAIETFWPWKKGGKLINLVGKNLQETTGEKFLNTTHKNRKSTRGCSIDLWNDPRINGETRRDLFYSLISFCFVICAL